MECNKICGIKTTKTGGIENSICHLKVAGLLYVRQLINMNCGKAKNVWKAELALMQKTQLKKLNLSQKIMDF